MAFCYQINWTWSREENIWAAESGNVPSVMCAKRRFKSACAFSQSGQSFRCPHDDSLHPWLSKIRPVKILISLRECAGWSESWLAARFWRYGSYVLYKYDMRRLVSFCRVYPEHRHILVGTDQLLLQYVIQNSSNITKTHLFKYIENFITKNEYPQSMFWSEIGKIMYTPVNPFYYIKVGFRWTKII